MGNDKRNMGATSSWVWKIGVIQKAELTRWGITHKAIYLSHSLQRSVALF